MKKEIEILTELQTKQLMNGLTAQRLLVGSLVNYLIKNGQVDADEYLKHTLDVKNMLLEHKNFSSEEEEDLLKVLFDLHINDLKKPE